MYAIEAKGLVKQFDGFHAVDGVDLEIPEGSIFGTLGPNGAGKTTTLRMLLGIGAMAATAHEVQTISTPITIMQMMNFFFATYALTKTGQPIELFAVIFPFSSPFAMIGRAALEPTLWHHGLAIIGQLLFAALVLRVDVYLFKKNVMKSGNADRVSDEPSRKLFRLIKMRR